MNILLRTTEWKRFPDRDLRWKKYFSVFPKKTQDAGWIWLRVYWVYEQISGWGFWDEIVYANPVIQMLKNAD